MSVELFITNLEFLTKLQAVFNLDDFVLNFNVTQINMQGEFLPKMNKHACTSVRYTRVHSLSKFTWCKQSDDTSTVIKILHTC